jgi:small subunit ribosomal protein S14
MGIMKSLIERDKKKRQLVAKYEQKRLILKTLKADRSLSNDIRWVANLELAALPKNSSKTRINNRCILTGRGKAVLRSFRVSRITLRILASYGMISGLKKSSW